MVTRRARIEPLEARWVLATFTEFIDPNPNPGNRFGDSVVALSTGNVVITSPFDDAGGVDAGAVYLFNGASGELISTLTGSSNDDQVGSGGATALEGGNFVVASPRWDNGPAVNAGAVTWGDGTSGISGTVGDGNSLVGSTAGDNVGGSFLGGSITVLEGGNFVVASPVWDNGAAVNAGAATWSDGTVVGPVGPGNSLVGSTAGDQVGFGVTALEGGNFVVASPAWDNGGTVDAGAATWSDGTVVGPVDPGNSLVGSTAVDLVGESVAALEGGNFVVASPAWDNGGTVDAGAATWSDGTVVGAVDAGNSLVGSTAGDQVGFGGVTALEGGNFVVASRSWDNGGTVDAGAATWSDGTVVGPVDPFNSLVGSTADDRVGSHGVTALEGGNFVVASPRWDNGGTVDAGAATWSDGTVVGPVDAGNSLVGSTADDLVGDSITALEGGNFVVASPVWDNGAAVNAGAATWSDGTVVGPVDPFNSLVGSTTGDAVGTSITALEGGNFVVASPNWANGGTFDAGAATWSDGTVIGPVDPGNSLVGSTTGDLVGGFVRVTALEGGNFVVASPVWNNGAAVNAGAATWSDGTVVGPVDPANSLVGSTADDRVGFDGVTALEGGNFVVASRSWDNGPLANAGAVTWSDGAVVGPVTSANSLVGLASNTDLQPVVADDVNDTFFGRFVEEDNGKVRVGSQYFGIVPADVVIPGTQGDDDFRVTLDPTGTDVEVYQDGDLVASYPLGTVGSLDSLIIEGLGGNDTLVVDSSHGLVDVPEGIRFDGGSGFDRLELQQNGGEQTSESIHIGQTPGAGQHVLSGPGGTQTIQFENLEPIVTGVAVTDFDISSFPGLASLLQDDNQINYQVSELLGPTWGRVTVDNYEFIDFINKQNLIIDAGAGTDTINLANPNIPTGLTVITVDGDDPTVSDTVIVNNTMAGTAIAVDNLSIDGATITGAQPVAVDVDGAEHLVIHGQAAEDDLIIESPTTFDLISLLPGIHRMEGRILIQPVEEADLLPIEFVSFDGSATLEFRDASGNRRDDLFIHGTGLDDIFTISPAGEIGLDGHFRSIRTPAINDVEMLGLEGNDEFVVAAEHPFTDVRAKGHGGDDEVVFRFAGGDIEVGLRTGRIQRDTFGRLFFRGAETVVAGAVAPGITANLSFEATSLDDHTTISPFVSTFGVNGIRLQNNGDSPEFLLGSIDTFTLDQLGGDDRLEVRYTSDADAIDVDLPAGSISDGVLQTINFAVANTEAVEIFGDQGQDTITVTPDAGTTVLVDGGDPIGTVPGDTLLINATRGVTFTPGADNDEGSFAFAGDRPVNFDRIESVSVDLAGAGGTATLMGTGADDDITAVGIAAGTVDVQVVDGPIQRYLGASELTLQGNSGDDDITVDLNLAGLGVTFDVQGGLPTADSDTLRVTGVDDDLPDAVVWAPSGADSGTMTVLTETIDVDGIENLVYDGLGDLDRVRIDASNSFVHTPGTTQDSGRVEIQLGTQSQLGLSYENLGANGRIIFNGLGESNFAVYRGTEASDRFAWRFMAADSIDLRTLINSLASTIMETINVQGYRLDGLEGDDVFIGNTTATGGAADASLGVDIRGGGPGGDTDIFELRSTEVVDTRIAPHTSTSDRQEISGHGPVPIDVGGIELLRYVDTSSGDRLTIDPGSGNNDLRIEAQTTSYDLLTSDSLPPIEIRGPDRVVVDTASAESDVVTIKTDAIGGVYDLQGNANDSLVIEGSDGNADVYAIANPAVGDVLVTDNRSGAALTATGIGRLQVNTLGGDDLVTVDESGGLLRPAIGYDGGDGADVLDVTGTTLVINETYRPGPEPTGGRLTLDSMIIDVINIEPIHNNVLSVNIIIRADHADNAINYSMGPSIAPIFGGTPTALISIDGKETIELNNKQIVVIDGLAGDDVIHLTNPGTPLLLTMLDIRGGDPNASDTVIVSGSAVFDNVVIDLVNNDGARIVGAQGVPVLVDMAEHLQYAGRGGNDTLSVTTPAGATLIGLRDGPLADAGEIEMRIVGGATLLPIAFSDLGAGGSLTFLDAAAARADELVISAIDPAAASALFTVNAAGTVSLDSTSGTRELFDVMTPSIDVLRLQAFADDDRFDIVGGHPFGRVFVVGGQPGDGSDELNFSGTGAPITVDLDAKTITESGSGAVVYQGIEVANVVAAAQDVTVNATAGSDDTYVTPTGANSATLVNNNSSPTFQLSAVGTLLIDQLGGDDTLRVDYTSQPDAIDVDVPAGSIGHAALESVTFTNANTESVRVAGQGGDDTLTVTPDPSIPVFIDGGDPIGSSAGDTLELVGPAIFEPGPEADDGRFIVPGNEPISFDHIEAAVVSGGPAPSTAFIIGNGADNDITIIARDASTHAGANGSRDFTSTVDGGIEVLWINHDQLVVDARSGDDDIVVRTPAPNDADWDVDAWIFGGAPAAGPGDDGDRLVVETPQTTFDAVRYTPTSVDSGTLVIDEDNNGGIGGTDTVIQIGSVPAMPPMPGFPDPDPGGIELLVYDGGGGDDNIEVRGDGGASAADRVHHIPGDAPDKGLLRFTAGRDALLGIHYENLGLDGTLTVNGRSSLNEIVLLGTTAADAFSVNFTGNRAAEVSLTTSDRFHIDLFTTNVERYLVETLDGDDDIRLSAPILASFFEVRGGSPGTGSDLLALLADTDVADNDVSIRPDLTDPHKQDINGLGPQINVSGIEFINLLGSQAQGDSLTVQLGDGDNVARVERGSDVFIPAGDLVTSDSLPDIRFTGLDGPLDEFLVEGQGGSDVVTFATRNLAGARNTNYAFDGDATDLLVIEGSDGAGDDFTVSNPAGGSVAVTDNNGTNVTVTAIGSEQGRLQISSLGGDDLVTVDVDGASDVIGVPIAFDGGGGSDLLNTVGDPATAVETVTYTPGPNVTEGRLLYTDAASGVLMTIDFDNLEPLNDFILAVNLEVEATGSSNDVTYRAGAAANIGQVSIDDFETIDFQNKQNLILNGLGGNDRIVLDNADLPTSLQAVAVLAGIGDDSVSVLALPDASTTTFVSATIDGEDGNDTMDASGLAVDTPMNINGGRGSDVLIGGRGSDDIDGGGGDDTMIGGDPAITPQIGNNTYDGGGGLDTIGILGTSAMDAIDVDQTSTGTLVSVVNGNTSNETFTGTEAARIDGQLGDDVIRLDIDDSLFVAAADPDTQVLAYTVVGGASSIGDRLIVVDDGLGDTIIHRISRVPDHGTVNVAPAHPGGAAPPIVYEGVERIDVTPVDDITSQTGTDGMGRLFTFKPDPLEANDQLAGATYLGSGTAINVDPTIDPGPGPLGTPGDQDWYRLVARATGTLDLQVYFQSRGTLANGRSGLPGNGDLDIFAFDSAGNPITGFGSNENAADDADERIRMPVVQGQTYYLRVDDGTAGAINVYSLSAVNLQPPIPYAMELDDNPPNGQTNPPGTQGDTSDTGRSQFDNHTYDNTPTLFIRLDDGIFLHDLPGNPADDGPPDEVIPIPFRPGVTQPSQPGYAIAIFDEGDTPPQTGGAPQDPLGFATAVAGQEGVYTFTVPAANALSEGSHFLTARVQMIDPAGLGQTGFGPRSVPLEIVVDRTEPPITFGDPGSGLHPRSDSGDPALASTLRDRITNDLTPTFFGRAEADSIVRAYVDADNNGALNLAIDVLIGQTVAIPIDGTNQAPRGEWEITSTVNMNDPNLLGALGADGLRRIFVTAEDLSGNISSPDNESTLEIFLDTQGPQVTDVFITGIPTAEFNLFTLKPETPRPTPRVDSLTISVRDLPDRLIPFLYAAISNGPPAPLDPIVLVGDHSGVIPIAGLAFNSDPLVPGSPATGEFVLNFADPLPDDRYTLTLSDNLIDPAGNRLDGESNAAEPIGVPEFQLPGRTSGDGIPGGQFVARFTIDSRPELATWSQGAVYVDVNGNLVWDPEGQDNDAVNRDFAYRFGEASDGCFAGDFASATAVTSSGFDKMGAYGLVNGQYHFFLDTDDDGVGDTVGSMAFQVNALPVAGDFDPGHPGDEIGAYDGQNFYLDVNGNNRIDAGERFPTDLRGIPLAGDFNGDGDDDLVVYDNNTGVFHFDLDRDGDVDNTMEFGFAGFGDRPVAGDVNLDGVDDIVLWVTHQNAQLPKESGEFHFLVSDRIAAMPTGVFDPFSPAPLGNDLISLFGDEFALPLLGNFDPPLGDDGGGATFIGSLSNELDPMDTTVDGVVTSRDALVVINALAREGLNVQSSPIRVVASLGGFKLDATQDGNITARDALVVINALARQEFGGHEAEPIGQAAVDRVMAELDDDDDLLALLAMDRENSRVKS